MRREKLSDQTLTPYPVARLLHPRPLGAALTYIRSRFNSLSGKFSGSGWLGPW